MTCGGREGWRCEGCDRCGGREGWRCEGCDRCGAEMGVAVTTDFSETIGAAIGVQVGTKTCRALADITGDKTALETAAGVAWCT